MSLVVMVTVTLMVSNTGTMAHIPLSQPTPNTTDLQNLMQDYWHWKTQNFPQFTSEVGINDDTAGHLDSYSLAHFEQSKVKCEQLLSRAEKIDTTSLSPDDLVNLNIFKYDMTTFLENSKYIKYFAPVTYTTGPQKDLKNLAEIYMTLNDYHDYQKLLSRYGEFPRQAEEILELLNGNMKNGLMPSNWSMVGVLEKFDSLGGPDEDSVFYKPFIHLPQNISAEDQVTLREQAREKIKKDLFPFLKKLRDFIERDYMPATRPEIGVSSLEGGHDYYQACLRFHTSTNLTPQEVHNLGLAEVDRIEKLVQKTAAEIGMEGKTFSEISQALREDPDQGFSNKEDVLSTYRNAVYNAIMPLMPQLFTTVPQENVTVEGDDDPNASFAMYRTASIDGSRLGSFVLNTHNYAMHKRYEVTALSLHETVPGHHLHRLYTQRNPSMPNFRKFVDYTRSTASPSKFPFHVAFTEGWGLYSEFLGEELGLYQDPYQRLGRYSYELIRASRLVVDTGMHALGWSHERASAFLKDHTAATEEGIQIQIKRYITWPGQACSYKIGEMKIKELRHKAQIALGELFSLPEFHDVLILCTGPLNIVEECVDNYIERQSLVTKKIPELEKEEGTMKSDINAENEIVDETDGAASVFGVRNAVILTSSLLCSLLQHLLR